MLLFGTHRDLVRSTQVQTDYNSLSSVSVGQHGLTLFVQLKGYPTPHTIGRVNPLDPFTDEVKRYLKVKFTQVDNVSSRSLAINTDMCQARHFSQDEASQEFFRSTVEGNNFLCAGRSLDELDAVSLQNSWLYHT